MRNVNPHLLAQKMDEAVTHYINSHHQQSEVHVDGTLSLNMQDDAGRVVTIMPGQGFTTQMNRQVSVNDQVENTSWNEELLDPDMRLAQLVAQLTHQSRHSQHQSKLTSIRDVVSSEILGTPLRLFNGQTMDTQPDSIVVSVPSLPPLPTLQDMKRCPEADWFSKDKNSIKENAEILAEADGQIIELNTGTSPAQNKQQNKKSLPHKKRISRKLKRHNNGSTSQQQDVVVINYHEDVQHEEILPDNFVTGVQHQQHLSDDTHHITQEVRPILICQLCGEFYGEDQLKFYQHLKQHYEPHATIIIENPVTDLAIDKMANSCIVDNGAALPDSIVELSLENTVPKTIYQPMDKHILYTTTDKTLYTNKVQYSIAGMEKETVVPVSEADKADLYDTLDKLELYNCGKCNKTFRKQKQCEAHVKEVHGNTKLEEMGEFSEPEDLMEGIHVEVEEAADQYDQSLLPHITVENGHVHQEHARHWYMRPGGGGLAACGADAGYCPLCAGRTHADAHTQLKEEVLQRIFDSEVGTDQSFADNIIQDAELNVEPDLEPEPEAEPEAEPEPEPGPKSDPGPEDDKAETKKKSKKCECQQCGRVFYHRNSLMYHLLSHREKQHECKECGKEFYTTNALKVHKRVHNDDRPYKCEECGREFRQWSDLKYHKVSRHSNQKLFKCEFCGKEFARKYSLNVHRRIHTGEKNYKCEYCNKTFRASSYRLSHMRVHTGDRPFKCSTCEKAFRVPGDLRRHMLTHEKYRKRLDGVEDPLKQKEEVVDAKNTVKTDIKPDLKELEQITSKVKKIAVASTSRPPLLKSVDKKPKPAKKPTNKKGAAPNVTVMDVKRNGEQFKMIELPNNVEVFDTRQELSKFKQVYESNVDFNKDGAFKSKEYSEQIVGFKDCDDRDLATLRPTLFRGSVCEDSGKVEYSRNDNTDGKMQVFTHVERSTQLAPASLVDIRGLERDRPDLHPETIENGFLENLTALYNIPAV